MSSSVSIEKLALTYRRIEPGLYPIQPGDNMDVGDANFACAAGGVPCAVTVAANGTTITSNGGVATATNSMAALDTIKAIALVAILDTDVTNALDIDMTDDVTTGVTRSTDGNVTKITFELGDANPEYTSEAVDTGHEIDEWNGYTLKRNAGSPAMPQPDEATVYTDIKPATPGKLKYGGDGNPMVPPLTHFQFVLDAGQGVDADLDEEFTGVLITGGSRIPGTFTCPATGSCGLPETMPNAVSSERTLTMFTQDGVGDWTFESDVNHEAGATQDSDYTYFGYWLQDPVPNAVAPTYTFATFSGGNDEFDLEELVNNPIDDALTATYEGGAAGMYVTRKLSVKNQQVDMQSPGFHGRFTAKAKLKANFGAFPDVVVDTVTTNAGNQIEGSITDFKDGNTDLGFKVTLNARTIADGGIMALKDDTQVAAASAVFSDTPTNSGKHGDG